MSSTPFGEHLRREREMRGVSLEEISAATRISTRFLEALEKEEWDHLPGGVFNRGFIRSVARFLGLDEESLVAEYALETKGRIDTGVVPDAPIAPSRNWGPAIVSAIILCALIAAGWFVFTRYGAAIAAKLHRKTAIASAAPPAPAAIAPAANVPLDLKIAAEKPAAVRVVADGQTIFDGPLDSGAAKRFQANTSLEVAASESSAISLELNGQTVPPIGLPGQPGSVTLTRSDLKTAAGGPH
ncbi:MAG TPA: RodZ domain-containing protein [Candidatus Limnocylindrales bacterium]|jgi:transcriptional regulator with XRE-family HTH domain|nr:RodZ domain-containing protein [Candidatus Limnocylindrales bacterium]